MRSNNNWCKRAFNEKARATISVRKWQQEVRREWCAKKKKEIGSIPLRGYMAGGGAQASGVQKALTHKRKRERVRREIEQIIIAFALVGSSAAQRDSHRRAVGGLIDRATSISLLSLCLVSSSKRPPPLSAHFLQFALYDLFSCASFIYFFFFLISTICFAIPTQLPCFTLSDASYIVSVCGSGSEHTSCINSV